MAQKKKSDSTEIEKVDINTMLEARPDYIEESRTGTEHITKDDMLMPRLALTQKMSPELSEAEPKFIEGLRDGDLFNTLTKQIYGRGPQEFIVVRGDVPRGIEFNPIEEGGGIVDMNVPLTDPRMQFIDGEKPKATKFMDFILLLVPSREVIAVSFKSTGLKTGRLLNSLIQMRSRSKPTPIYGGKYVLTSEPTKNSMGSFFVYKVDNAGWPSKEDHAIAKSIHESLSGKEVKIDRGAPDPDSEDAEKEEM